ncbi:Eco57I restriction-modification methylase domain-containing protein [Algoriphagus sp. AGSA1]|uniref:DUF7149 domain-containing protein n=1 Tax=Algoriphagus sp. AGSA1 TaxID=2907213 RepID=UPI001F451381|nr:Eco57I restriction-modification methylase domain-containing protein [Algoriphagus sp. AGSA1]MCE7057973.1 Eco57I restriction-modification methylase domain-containing protein [Algoriphagus sp. AGSA1]
MTFSILDIKSSLDQAYRLIMPLRQDLDRFKTNLKQLIAQINEKESEEHVKIFLMDFLKNTFYHPDYLVATKGKADFVIHLDKTSSSPVGVLFEVKKPTNKAEMVTRENLNTRAMHELILYFLRERVNNKNYSLTNLIITNIYEWFVFDAALFEKIFTTNTRLQKAYKEWDAGQSISSKTDLFYNEIAKPFLQELDKEIAFTHFDLRDYLKIIEAEGDRNDKKLIPLYKFFTPVHFLKLPFVSDSNTLDKGFFAELLHIVGLEETKEQSKKIIRRPPLENRERGSLLENTINLLQLEGTWRSVSSIEQYGKNNEERIFNIALSLCLTWINRILFLKLLEAQLLRYHQENKEFRFLNFRTIPNFDELYKLFFQVLALQAIDRSEFVQGKFSHIPYLNSSLFEISELEKGTLRINALDDNLKMKTFKSSILKKRVKNFEEELNPLEYLFLFLDAYDFSSVGKEDVQEENKSIINAAVLGLVFEKINGYRDGAIYTPGAITMYMCKETIRRAVLKKFKDAFSWDIDNLDDLNNYIGNKRKTTDILEYNRLLDSIKIIDPAVGSGHFLVSSLNELILIKAELGILADSSGRVITDIQVTIANDELILLRRNTQDFFDYQVKKDSSGNWKIDPESQRIQETIFNEKRRIIEGCLFGVDINPNSSKICRLRLWIELLKNAYYKVAGDGEQSKILELETLPNIDINIKSGNSLLSKYPLNEDLSEVFRKQNFSVAIYQDAVESYKNTPNKEAKEDLKQFIRKIKEQFRESVSRRDPKRKRLAEFRGQLSLLQNNFDLFGQKKSQKDVKSESKKWEAKIAKIEAEINEIESNAIYKNAFEWRIEFPEVLDSKGDFEGFEVVIGNPPYIQLQKMGEDADVLQKMGFETYVRTGDIYSLFYELGMNILKPGYYLGFITSNKWMRASYGQSLRKFFLEKTNPLQLIDFGGYQVFASATVDTNILVAQKEVFSGSVQTCLINKSIGSLEKMSVFIGQNSSIQKSFSEGAGWVILSPIEERIKQKIEAAGTPLKDWDVSIYRGILTGYNEAFIIDQQTRDRLVQASAKNAEIIRPILRGRDIKRYNATYASYWLINTHNGIKSSNIGRIDVQADFPDIYEHLNEYKDSLEIRLDKGDHWTNLRNCAYLDDLAKDKIVWIELTDKPNFYLDTDGFYLNNTIFFLSGKRLPFLLSFLNSKLSEWYFSKIAATSGAGTRRWIKLYIDQIHIPQIVNSEFEDKISALVLEIQELKKAGIDTDELEKTIDREIYNLFELTPDEIEILDTY